MSTETNHTRVESSSGPITPESEVTGKGPGREAGLTEMPRSEPEDVSPREECQTSEKDIASCPRQRMAGGKWAGCLRGSRMKSAEDV